MRTALAIAAAAALALGLLLWLSFDAPPAPPERPPLPTVPTVMDPPRVVLPEVRTGDGQLTGTVRTADGTPAAGQEVKVLFAARPTLPGSCARMLDGCHCGDGLAEALALLDRAFTPVGTTTTAADGSFRFSGLPPGALEVRVSDDTHFARATVALTGAPVALDLTLDQALSEYLVVYDEESEDMADGVGLVAVVDHQVVDFERTHAGFSYALLAPTNAVTAFAAGCTPANAGAEATQALEAEDGGVEPTRVLTLRRGHLLRGTVATKGAPIAGASVEAVSEDEKPGDRCATTTVTGADGAWVLGPVRSGSYLLRARAGTRSTRRTVSADDPPTALEVQEDVRVHGRVMDALKAPVRGATLELSWFPLENGEGEILHPVVDASGRFEHLGAPGQYALTARADGFLESTTRKDVPGGAWEALLVLEPSARVSGRVVSADGSPTGPIAVSGHSLTFGAASLSATFPMAKAADDGAFTLDTVPGDLEVEAQAEGMIPTHLVVRAPQSGLRIVLSRGAVVEGRVLDERGRLLANVPIRILPSDPRAMADAVSGADGTFRALGVADGPCVASAQTTHRDGLREVVERSGSASLEVRGGKGPFVELRLTPAKPAHGRVVDEANRPIAGARVTAAFGPPPQRAPPTVGYELRLTLAQMGTGFPVTSPAYPTAISAADGTFTLEGLGPSTYTLHAQAGKLHDDPEAPVEVRTGAEDVVLTLIPTHYLTAQVTDADGVPLPNVSIGGDWVTPVAGQARSEIRFSHTGPIGIWAQGFARATRQVVLSTRADTALGVVRLERGRLLSLKVTDARTGAVVASWLTIAGSTLARAGPDDPYTVPLGAFAATVDGVDHVGVTVEVGPAQTELAVALATGGTVVGTARGSDGRLLEPGLYHPRAQCPNPRHGSLRSDGAFVIKGVPIGPCRVAIVRSADQRSGPEKSIVVPDGEVTVTLVGP